MKVNVRASRAKREDAGTVSEAQLWELHWCHFSPVNAMPPVVIGIVQTLAEGQSVTNKLLSLRLVNKLFLFSLTLQLKTEGDVRLIDLAWIYCIQLRHKYWQYKSSYLVCQYGTICFTWNKRKGKRKEIADLLDVERSHGDDVVDVGTGSDFLHVWQVPARHITPLSV